MFTVNPKLYHYSMFPYGITRRRHNEIAPYSDYAKYALSKAPFPHIANMPIGDKVFKLWAKGDIENTYSLINSHMWMDKVKSTPSKEDLQWMNSVHHQKKDNWFNDRPVDYGLPKPKTPQQEKMLPWVTNVKTQNNIGKTASMNTVLAMMAKNRADQTGQMSAIDMARLNEMNMARRQRYSKLLRKATGSETASADMQRNNLGTATSTLLSVLLGAGVGAGIGSITGGSKGAKAGALLGTGGGAIVAGLGNVIGSIAGGMSKVPHQEALREFSDIGASRYLMPGASAYHRARLNNALADMEEGVERPRQMIV